MYSGQRFVTLLSPQIAQDICWGSGSAPRLGSGRTRNRCREAINTKQSKQTTTFIGCLSGLPRWHLCLAPTGITIIRLFSVDCGSLRQSGPRPDPRLLRQAALEALTRSARTDSPRRIGRKQFSGEDDGGGAWRRRRRRELRGRRRRLFLRV
ncbi:histidine kinase 1, 2, 3 plant [Dorcoceras hygrometricum]|uniref:Histidine kinase 1, 2, 3 plant n=1 Tax=Dorcoceras hygrometricum TaxID=472368 RepID=A0A2Z7D0R0_9LAMI|nr:histidine kinase 1, 2, 3 plant [Dorcoceras hygrometricum]